jgi:tight adherence protein B
MVLLAVNFVVVVLISFTILWFVMSKTATTSAMRTRLKTIHVAEYEDPTKATAVGAALKNAVSRRTAARLVRYLRSAPFAGGIEKLLREANSSLTVLSAALVSAGCAVAAALVCLLFLPVPLIVGAAFLLGSAAPYSVLRWQRNARLNAFNAQLPDALELMTRALRAGHALGSAIEVVGQESPAPLGPEFANVFQQQKLGVRFREAMIEMGERIPSPDLHFLITAMLVQRETGGDITEILERTTHVIRERWRIAAEVKTRTAQGKLTGWILGSLPVAMLALINLISPGYSHVLFHDPTGQKLLYAGAGFIVVGALVIRKIVDVKV